MNTQTNNQYIIPDVAIKIKELSSLKQTYLKLIIDMYPLLKDKLLNNYIYPLIRLLQNIINIHKYNILYEIEDGLTSVLITYIFDINAAIHGKLNLEKYELRHKNLIAINQRIDYYLENYDAKGVEELKNILFLI